MGLAQLIAEGGAEWADWPVERAVFGTAEPAAIAIEIERFVRDELGSAVQEPLFFESSVGSVFGLRLVDGRAVVVKAHQPDEPPQYLDAVHTVCTHLSEHGFPWPRPHSAIFDFEALPPGPSGSTSLRCARATPCGTRWGRGSSATSTGASSTSASATGT